ncbi:MAG: alpha/beta hydrolase, partial [Candidatus Brocadiaceae bacterium]
ASGERPVVLWCHGNAGNITHRAENLDLLARRGLAALLFDYRGYGQSQGRPCEDGLYADGEAAWRYLTGERGVAPGRIVCFGRSLGAAVALRVATLHRVAGLIVEGAFESAPAMARSMFPLIPVWPLMRNNFDNLGRIGDLDVPVLVVHGEEDGVVPVSQGKAVFAAASEPKKLYVVQGADHNDTYAVGGAAYFEQIESFCRECVRRAGQ